MFPFDNVIMQPHIKETKANLHHISDPYINKNSIWKIDTKWQ